MNLSKRAILYIVRKWKKSILLLLIILSVSTLVLSGLAIMDAQEEKSKELRGTTGASFSISRNLSTGGWGSGSNGSYSTQEFLSDEMLQRISEVEGIKGYNASITSILYLSDENNRPLEKLNPMGVSAVDSQFYSYGCINSQYSSLFLSNSMTLIEGEPIKPDDENTILLSKDIADKHDIKVGDTVLAVNDPYSNDATLTLKVKGIYEIMADKSDERNNYNMSSYYDYSNYAFLNMKTMKELLANYSDGQESDSADFYVSDPENLETVIQDVQSIDSINWNNFIITANNEVYEKSAGSMSNISTLITVMLSGITIISVVIITLILFMQVRGRKKEFGIMQAIGISKITIVIQYILEILLLAVCAFPLSYPLGKFISVFLGGLIGKNVGTITVTNAHFILVVSIGTILLISSVIMASIPLIKYKPKEMLSQME